jgi:hypothetical protein
MTWLNRILHAIAGLVGAAGAVAAAGQAGMVPASVAHAATQVITYGTLVGVAAAKASPGLFGNQPVQVPTKV